MTKIHTWIATSSLALTIPILASHNKWASYLVPSIGLIACATYKNETKHTPTELEEQLKVREREFNEKWDALDEREARLNQELSELDDKSKFILSERELLENEKRSFENWKKSEIGRINVELDQELRQKQAEFEKWSEEISERKQQVQRKDEMVKQQIKDALARVEEDRKNLETNHQTDIDRLKEQHLKEIAVWQEQNALLKRRLRHETRIIYPRKRDTLEGRYAWDIIDYTPEYRPDKPIFIDGYDRQPMDLGNHVSMWVTVRNLHDIETLRSDDYRNWIAAKCGVAVPFILPRFDEGCVEFQIPTSDKYKVPAEITRERKLEAARNLLKPIDSLKDFIFNHHHFAMWGTTGEGKTVLIRNLFMMLQEHYQGSAEIKTIIPKIDIDLAFRHIDFKGWQESIYGLLEAATEVKYRAEKNADQDSPTDWKPLIYLFDEYSQIAAGWNSINKDSFDRVVQTFKESLDPDRANVFTNTIEPGIRPTDFAPTLLEIIWREGRSLRVKSFITGQNLMPKTLGINKIDFQNTGFISFPSCMEVSRDYRVFESLREGLKNQQADLLELTENDPSIGRYVLLMGSGTNNFFCKVPGLDYYASSPYWVENPSTVKASPDMEPLPDMLLVNFEEVSIDENVDFTPTTPQTTQKVQNSPDVEPAYSFTLNDLKAVSTVPAYLSNLPEITFLARLPRKSDGNPSWTQIYELLGNPRSDKRKKIREIIEHLIVKHSS